MIIYFFVYKYRYQRRCDELEVVGGNIKSTFDQMTAEKKDIVSYLKKTLDDKCNLNFRGRLKKIYYTLHKHSFRSNIYVMLLCLSIFNSLNMLFEF